MAEGLVFQVKAFEGPLDLLLTLIQTHKMDIYDIPIAEILEQYLLQIERMQQAKMEVAAEFLEMAARLIYIKTAQLLPQNETAEEMKRQITEELLEYRAVQFAAGMLRLRGGPQTFVREPMPIPEPPYTRVHPTDTLLEAYQAVAGRARQKQTGARIITQFSEEIAQKPVSIPSRIVHLIRRLLRNGETAYHALFDDCDSISARVATFLALLELLAARRLLLRDTDGVYRIRLAQPDEVAPEGQTLPTP